MPRGRKRKPIAKSLPDCISCSKTLDDEYQSVFDDSGVELELQKLLEECFNMHVTQDDSKVQALCFDCLNDLIEAYDIKEKEEQDLKQDSLDEEMQEKLDEFDINGTGKPENEEEEEDVPEDEEQEENSTNEEFLTEMLETDDSDDLDDFLDNEVKEKPKTNNVDDGKEGTSKEIEQLGSDEENGQKEAANEKDEIQILYENVDFLEEIDENFDFKTYKEQILNSKFDDVVFPSEIQCRLCSQSINQHLAVLEHTTDKHCIEDFAYPCILDASCEPLKTLKELSFHLVFRHYDLERLTIYTQCPACLKRFNDFNSFNKHSCYASDSTIPRGCTECKQCGKNLKTNKRYRFHLQFHLDNHRPMACLICDKVYRDEGEFFEHIKYSHESSIGYTCIRCDRTFTSEQNLKNHENIHNVERPYECKLCPKSYIYNQLLKDHIIAHHTKKRPFQCHICNKFLNKQTLLNKHIMSHKETQVNEVRSCSICGLVGENEEETEKHVKEDHEDETNKGCIEVIHIDTVYCCEYCELAYRTPDDLRNHWNTHKKKLFYCNMCPSYYNEYKKVKTHKLTHLNYIDKRKTFPVMRHYMCDIANCTRSYMQWTSLRSHKRTKHFKKEISCDKCAQKFKNPIKYNKHMDEVHGGTLHSCPFCGKVFISKMAIAVHVARMHNTTKLKCDQCSSLFSTPYNLQQHKISTHSGFKCDICEKQLKNYKNLQVHLRMVHYKEKRYFCSYCNKGYFNNCDRQEHEDSVHERIKKFKCELCDYSAVYKQSLTIHMRAHRNETPYKCSLCQKGFRRAYALSLHMRRHNDIRDFVCPFDGCGSAYPNQGILNSHLRIKHPDGQNAKSRKRKTIGMNSTKDLQNQRQRFIVPPSAVFIDDDDGLDDGVIGDPPSKIMKTKENAENPDDPDDPVTYIIAELQENTAPAVIVQRNESDHDYIVRPDDSKIYGNVIEEYEIAEEEIISTVQR